MPDSVDLAALVREAPEEDRADLSQLLADPAAFADAVRRLTDPYRGTPVNRVAAIDAMGFALGGAVARELDAGLVLIRTRGKLPWTTMEISSDADYAGQTRDFEIVEDVLETRDQVLVVDDWSETGAQLSAAVRLVESTGAEVAGVACLRIDGAAREHPTLKRHRLHWIIE